VTAPTGPIGGPPYWLVTLVKWLTYLGLAVTVAAWPVWLLTIAPAVVANPAPRHLNRDMRATAVAGVVLLFVGSVLALVVQAWLARPRDGWLSRTGSVLTDSRYGTLWSWRMGAVLLLLALSIIALAYRSRVAAWLAAVSAFLIPLCFTLTAHANAQTEGRIGAITADWLHLSAAMLWSGGLVFLAVLVWSARPAPLALLQVAVPRFSTLAVAAWVILGLTGAYSAWLLAGSRDAMTDTPYGKTLLVKLGLLLPVVILAAMHLALFNERTRERPFRSLVKWFRWSLALELVLVIAVLLTVGRLVGLQPAGEALTAARPTGLTETLDLAGHPATLSISPGAPGPNSYTLAVPDAPSDPKVEGLLRLTPPGATQAQKEIKLTRQPDGTFAGSGSELALDGDWQIETIVRQIGSFQWQQRATVTIGPTAAPAQFRSGAWRFDGLGGAGMIILAAAIIALTMTPGRPANQNWTAAAAYIAIFIGIALMASGAS
jgi:copper transport protein